MANDHLATGGSYNTKTSANSTAPKTGAYIAQVENVFLVFDKMDNGAPILPGSIIVRGSGTSRNIDTIITHYLKKVKS